MKWKALAPAAVGALLVGITFGQNGTESDSSDEDFEWQMFGTTVTSLGGAMDAGSSSDDGMGTEAVPPGHVQGLAFIYNRRTGKVYRFFESCGADGEYGCFDDMPVLEGNMTATVPSPQSATGNVRRR